MFKISRRLDYGLQLLIALAAKNSDQLTPSAQLSEQLTIPLPFFTSNCPYFDAGGFNQGFSRSARGVADQ